MTTYKQLLFKTAKGIFNHEEDFAFQETEQHISSGVTFMHVKEEEEAVVIEFQVNFTFDMLEKVKKIVHRTKEIYPKETNFMIYVDWNIKHTFEDRKTMKKRTENLLLEIIKDIFSDGYSFSKKVKERICQEGGKAKYFSIKNKKSKTEQTNIKNSFDYINENLLKEGYEPRYMEDTGIFVNLLDMSVIFECGKSSLVSVSVTKNTNSLVIAEREIVDLRNIKEFSLYKMIENIVNASETEKKEKEYKKTLNAILDTAFVEKRPEYVLEQKINEKTLSKSAYFTFQNLDPKITTYELTKFLGKLFEEEGLFEVNEISKKIRKREIPFKLEKIEEGNFGNLICHISFKNETFQIHVSDFDVELYPKVL